LLIIAVNPIDLAVRQKSLVKHHDSVVLPLDGLYRHDELS
jgi:hypothetical protein